MTSIQNAETEETKSSSFIENIGGRKFLATVLCQLITGYLVFASKISSETYSVVIIATVGAFIAGNVLVHKAQNK